MGGHKDAYVTGLRNAERDGYCAGRAGHSRAHCPYKRGDMRQCWFEGWLDGMMTTTKKDKDNVLKNDER